MLYECERCGARLDPGERCDCQNDGLAMRCIQAPVISEDLEGVRRQLESVLSEVARLPRDDDSLKRVKTLRAELNRRFSAMEEQRKEVRQQVLQPYTKAEEKYKACIAEPYRDADGKLKNWVDDYQNGMKRACEERLQEYFDSLCSAQGVDFLRFSQCGVTVDMAMARQKEPRKAMDAIEAFVLKVRADMDAIMDLEGAAEVLTEYRQLLDLPEAILTVKRRRAAVDQMAQCLEFGREAALEAQKSREQLLAAAPELREQLPQEEICTMTFTVSGTLPELKALKAYILSTNLTIEEDDV